MIALRALPAGIVVAACLGIAPQLAAAAQALPANAGALADAMAGHRVVLLGEVHDNAAQHALRAQALRLLVERGARPALAFEQFDREQQAAIERARRERPGDVDYLVAQAGGAAGWQWNLYKPFVALALEYDLPIVAANLSRKEAMAVATAAPGADAGVTAELLRAHEAAIAAGHCDLLPVAALPGMARAQIARDRTLARAITAYARSGVVLLTGNGHARKDIGVAYWLARDAQAAAVSIGLLETDVAGKPVSPVKGFDAYVLTDPAPRPDPCEELRHRLQKPRPGATG